ncbi:MAG: hypothetical protein GQ564_20500, partial [Bacteroidales bacterium]|nr:hypothetical protein [Bacteroidales bacterium]
NVIYASPMELSVLAQNVDDPLPIDFVITANVSSILEIEVLSTENLTPEDFGLVSLHLLEVETFQFLVSVSELGSNQLLAAELKISNGSYVYIQNLDSIVNNIVTVKDGFDEYIIEIIETGYETYIDTITNTVLKSYESTPFVIELIPVDNITVTDIDGNVYQTVQIGDQIWMAENLKTTKYNDGTAIALVTDNTEWENLTTGAYCWYNNDEASYKNTYGALYNWYTVITGKLCPTGWHVPTDAEWTMLTTYLGGESIAGGKLKETGITHWETDNTGATNEAGFTALPGGYRFFNGMFSDIGYRSYWWSATEYGATGAWARSVYYGSSNTSRTANGKKEGFSVRCIRD